VAEASVTIISTNLSESMLDVAHPYAPEQYVRIRLSDHTAVVLPKAYTFRSDSHCNVLGMYSTPALLFARQVS
jgi:hypothetical protein